jgi:diacylglycerol kinase
MDSSMPQITRPSPPIELNPSAGSQSRAENPASGELNRMPLIGRIARSFYFAFHGLAYLFGTQRNARIEAGIGVITCALAAWLHITRAEWAVLLFTIALVLILEGLNTAIEAAVDLASPDLHPKAKAAKDLAAGMVLVAALASIGVGLLILGPPLWHRMFPS